MKRLEDMAEPELRELMLACANQLMATFAAMGCDKPLFALVVFNDPAVAQYIGNCDRRDIVAAMRETAERLERSQDVTR